ncbi:glutamate receptor 2.9-like [Neltuma alba]|uniref:glutamate receptor 2.9-like n=1 Tax=Neltuma alba TaxID=207710 RepID=UPI0010A317B3|nr:glutamate receptor 2.9-like [Prosopis alba]
MARPNYYHYGNLITISCVVLLIAEIVAGDGEAGSLLGGKKLIIGLPKKTGFTQFVDVQLNSSNNNQIVKITGYSIDVFHAAITYLKSLHYNISFEFRAFVDEDGNSAGDYNALVYQIFEGKYDAVVGDVSILAHRSNYVDFTVPYEPSDIKMLVKVRHDPRLNMWIFVRPFRWDLWLSIAIFSTFIGGIILLMERTVKEDSAFEDSPYRKQLSGVSVLWLPVEQAVLPEKVLVKNCSKFVLVMWLILAFVLMQSYTASLSSMLTVHQLQPRYLSEYDVITDPNINVGHHCNSFIGGLLIDGLKIDRSRVKNYPDIKEYKEALDKGSLKGGVDAILDHISHVKVFLKQYGSDYAMVDTRHRIGGFAFAFPKGSNLTSYFSRAILNVRESGEVDKIEEKYFGSNHENYEGQGLSTSSSDNASSNLTTYSFAGLFMVIGILSLLALAVSESHIWQKPVILARTYSRQLLMSWSFTRTSSLKGGSTSRRTIDGEGFTMRENNQNIGLQADHIKPCQLFDV